MYFSTFSIVGHDSKTGMLGVAVASKALAVGALCPFARAGVGAVASQAYSNPYLGVDSLRLLAEGLEPADALERVLEQDPGRDWRQLAIVDSNGNSIAFTGKRTDPWSGHKAGPNYATAGNLLVSSDTIDAMAESFESSPEEELPERLMRSLQAGQAAGGDRRGRQAAALFVMNQLELPYIDLRVDDHPDAVTDLRRIFELGKESRLLGGRRVSSVREPKGPAELEVYQRLLLEMLALQEQSKEKFREAQSFISR